jgi:hypothetical protein
MPRVRSFALAVMLTAFCAFPPLTLSLALQPQPSAPPAPAAPAAPVDVRVGVYVVQLGDPDLKDSSFKAVFWLWFRWKGSPDLDPMKKFEVVGGQVEACDNQDKKVVGDETYVVARVRATVTQDFDIARFPVDQHTLELSVEETTDSTTGIRYVADTENSKLQDSISLSGWVIGKPAVAASTKVYASNFGDPSLPSDSQSEYSRFTLSVPVRRPGISYTLKLFWSLYLSVFVALIALHIKPFDLDPRFGLGVGAVFAAMASAYVISSALPDSNQFTIADGVVMCAIGFIVASIIESIVSLRLHQCGKEAASRRLDAVMFFVFAGAYAGFNIWILAR